MRAWEGNVQTQVSVATGPQKCRYALITGASSGIGKALAFEFAAHGFGLVLVARRADKLGEVANACQQRFHTPAFCVSLDLCDTPHAITQLTHFLKETGIEIEVLVNNAGFGVHGEFAQTPLNAEIDLVHLQIATTLALTKLFLPSMMARKSGYILNVASVYSFVAVPYQSVYGACKAFMLSHANALAYETKAHNIRVCTVCPGTTATNFRAHLGPDHFLFRGMGADAVAKISYRALMKGQRVCVPRFSNQLFVYLFCWLPVSLLSRLVAYFNGLRQVNRARM